MGSSLKNVDPETLPAGQVHWGSSSYHNNWNYRLLPGLVPIMAAVSNWTQLEADWSLVRSWAEEQGVTTFAAVGKL